MPTTYSVYYPDRIWAFFAAGLRFTVNRFLPIAIFCASCAYCLGIARAQSAETTPLTPQRFNDDENGVDVLSGSFASPRTDVSMGVSPDNGMFYQRNPGPYSINTMMPAMGMTVDQDKTNCCSPGGTIGISVNGNTDVFYPYTPINTWPQSPPTSYYSAASDGATLSVGAHLPGDGPDLGNSYIYTDRLGNVTRAAATAMAATDFEGVIKDVTRPDGFVTRYTYVAVPVCVSIVLQNGVRVCQDQHPGYKHVLMKMENSANYVAYFNKSFTPDPILRTDAFTSYTDTPFVTLVNSALDSCGSADACTPSATRPTAIYNTIVGVIDPLARHTAYWIANWRDYCPAPSGNVGADYSHVAILHDGATVPEKMVCYYDADATMLATPLKPDTTGMVEWVIAGSGKYTYRYAETWVTNPQTGATLNIFRTTTVDGPNGYRRVYYGDWARGQVLTITDELGKITSFSYDSFNRIISKTNPEGDKWVYTYDGRGNVVEARHVAKVPGSPADIVYGATYPATCTYTASCNKPSQTTDSRGGITNYEYDNTTGQVTRILSPAGTDGRRPEKRYAYTRINGVSMLQSVSTCQNNTNCVGTADEVLTVYQYNTNLLPVSETKKLGDGTILAVVANAYDTVGNKISSDGPLAGAADTTRYIYNADRELIGEIEPGAPDASGASRNVARRVTYTSFGRPTLEEDGYTLGQDDPAWQAFTVLSSVRTIYGSDERKAAEYKQDASGIALTATQFSYDANGRIECTAVRMNSSLFASLPAACIQSAQGSYGPDRITKNLYDAAGHLVQIRKGVGTPLEQAYATYSYTPNGKQEYVVDANGGRMRLTYDGFDRQVAWYFPSQSKPTAFNPATPTTALASAGAVSTTDYEAYGYDPGDNRTSLRKRDGNTIIYAFDALNRVATKIEPGASVYYGYDLQGRKLYTRFGSATGAGIAHTYDGLGRELSSSNNLSGTAMTLGYQWDAAGNRTRLTFPDGTFFTFTYDATSRQTGISENGSTSVATFSYDRAGRRSAESRGGVMRTFGYDALSRVVSWSDDLAGSADDLSTTFTYNPAGQIASEIKSNLGYAFTGFIPLSRAYVANGLNQYSASGTALFTYDANGNLTSDGTNGYTYDVENRLISRTGGVSISYDPDGRLWQTSGGATGTTRYLFDGDDLVAEYDASGHLLRRYVHGPGEDNPILWYEGSGLADRRSLQPDQLGSVVSVANAAGSRLAINTYDEYGIPGGANIGRFQFTGQAWLPDLGMYYYKARIYSATLGRFMQIDPIGYEDQLNLYSYANNDAVNNRDPNGDMTINCNVIGIPYTGGTITCTPQDDGNDFTTVNFSFDGFHQSTVIVPGDATKNPVSMAAVEVAKSEFLKQFGLHNAGPIKEGYRDGSGGAQPSRGDGSAAGSGRSGSTASAESKFWRSLENFRNGLKRDSQGNYYSYDRRHGEIEVFNGRGAHLGTRNAETGAWEKSADPNKSLKL